jgi:hypothetical protein
VIKEFGTLLILFRVSLAGLTFLTIIQRHLRLFPTPKEVVMPFIRYYIPPHAEFDPAALAAMGNAYDRAIASFSTRPPQKLREAIADKIIQLAQQGLLDPVRLCEEALAAYALKSKCAGDLPSRDTPAPDLKTF